MFKDSISKFFKVDSLLNHLSGYVETKFELLKIEVREDLARNLSRIILYFLVTFVFALFITFLSIAAALVLSSHFGTFTGFSIVSGFYLLIAIILLLSREKIIANLERRFALMFRKKK